MDTKKLFIHYLEKNEKGNKKYKSIHAFTQKGKKKMNNRDGLAVLAVTGEWTLGLAAEFCSTLSTSRLIILIFLKLRNFTFDFSRK
jgi:hypothetical protein